MPRSADFRCVTSRSSRTIRPFCTRLSPQIVSSSVVFPQPVLPMRTAYSPVATLNDTLSREKAPARTVRSVMEIIAGPSDRSPLAEEPHDHQYGRGDGDHEQ